MQSNANQLKPAILETFGDIAQAIGTQFDTYLPVVGQVLQQASTVTTSTDITIEMLDYIISLREGIMDAWGGILLSYKGTPQGTFLIQLASFALLTTLVAQLQPFVESIFQLLHIISQDPGSRSEGLMRASMGVIGYVCHSCSVVANANGTSDLVDAFPNGEFAGFFRQEWVTSLVRETRTSREYGPRTIDTARWAREQVKRQINISTAAMS